MYFILFLIKLHELLGYSWFGAADNMPRQWGLDLTREAVFQWQVDHALLACVRTLCGSQPPSGPEVLVGETSDCTPAGLA